MAEKITPGRKRIFTVVMIVLPFLLLALLEVGLRVAGFGSDYPLVKKEKRFGKDKWVVNSAVTGRYFNLPPSIIPEAADEAMDYKKKEKALRIICLGGSTTAGFPYEINANFPFQLQYRLREAISEHYVEVINLGISAVNSYTILDLMPEILALEPDALVLYAGHNEFYGAYGSLSTQKIGDNRTLILNYLKLRRFRTVQLLQKLMGLFSSGSGESADAPLMQVMSAGKTLPYDDEKLQATLENYRANLTDIVKQAKSANVPIILSTLVSNLADQAPFVSDYNHLDEAGKNRSNAKLLEGQSLLSAAEYDDAIAAFEEVLAMAPNAANAHYYRAQTMLERKDSSGVYEGFARARDLDMLRFRAPGAINPIIEAVAKEQDQPFVDMEKIFRRASAGGVPGERFFVEHLHPNFAGYRLMAQTFFEVLKKIQIINPPEKIGWKDNLINDESIAGILAEFQNKDGGVTQLDLEFGKMRTFFLTRRWPFTNQPSDSSLYITNAPAIVKDLAYRHLQGKVYWDEAHYELAQWLLKDDQPEAAIHQYSTVHRAFHENYVPAMRIGDIYGRQEQWGKARLWYERGLKRNPDNPFLNAKVAQIYVAQNRFEQAAEALQKSLSGSNDGTMRLNEGQQKLAFYFLGLSYANLKNLDAAEAAINNALRIDANYQPAIGLANSIRAYRKNNQ